MDGRRGGGDGLEFTDCSDSRGTVVGEDDATRAGGGVARSFLCRPALEPGGELLKLNVRRVKPDRVGDDGATGCLSALGLEGTGIEGIAGTGGISSSSSSLTRCDFFGFLRKKAIVRDFPLLDFCDLLEDADRYPPSEE